MPCTGTKTISTLGQNPALSATDLFLIEKGGTFYKEPRSMHIASQAEVDAGTDTLKAVTPATLAAAPKQDIGVFDTGMLRVIANPLTGETFTITVNVVTKIFEFTVGGGLTVGDIEVVKGATPALTADAWIIAINNSVLSMSAIINPAVTNLIGWITNNANEAVTLVDGTAGDITYTQADDQRAAANLIPIYREYTVLAADIAAGAIMFRFPVSSFPDGVLITSNDGGGLIAMQSISIIGTDTYTVTNGDVNILLPGTGYLAGSIIKFFGMGQI